MPCSPRGHHEVAVLDAAPHILVDLPYGQTVRCRVVNVKDDGTIQVVPEHAVVIR